MKQAGYKIAFQNAMERLQKKGVYGLSLVERAFLLAEKSHEGQVRKSGDPYISHPVEVMIILEELNFSSEVLAAALLHDVVEDTKVGLKEIEKRFGPVVAKIVDAVTEIKPNEKIADIDAEIKTYQKLVEIGKINYFAFYIKFADRLHNLKTLSVFKRYKQLEKTKQTERFLVPLLKLLKAKDLHTAITNQIFLVQEEEDDVEKYLQLYNQNIKRHDKTNQETLSNLNLTTNKFISKNQFDNSLLKVKVLPLTPLEVRQEIEKAYDMKNLRNITLSHFSTVPTFKIIFLFSNPDFQNLIFQLFQDRDFSNIITLKNYMFDSFNQKEYFIFKNRVRTNYKTLFFTPISYTLYRNGSTNGSILDMVEEHFEDEIIGDYITIKTRSDEVLLMPEGSTVLDFAFQIHNDFGFSCKYAHLNNSPQKTPIYRKLSNGDKVELIIEEDENKNAKNIARLKWLTYVNNQKSKKQLLKYFENLYE